MTVLKKTAQPIAVTRETSPSEESLQVSTAPEGTPHVEIHPGGVQVWMPLDRAAGVLKFGEMVPGTVYTVSPAEALRLVTAKGFRFASAHAQTQVSDHIDGIADAIQRSSKE